jgi:hypothetical protein
MTPPRLSHPVVSGLGLTLAILGIALGGWKAAAQDPGQTETFAAIAEYARDPGTVVIHFTETLGEIALPEGGPSLRVYGDGRAVVHYPRYMKRAGDYRVQLSQEEMDRLMRLLVDRTVLEFDPKAARRAKQNAAAARRAAGEPAFYVSDASTTTVEVRLDRYKPRGLGRPLARDVHKTISWHGLRPEVRQYPEIESIRNLHAAQRELRAILKRPDLVKVE